MKPTWHQGGQRQVGRAHQPDHQVEVGDLRECRERADAKARRPPAVSVSSASVRRTRPPDLTQSMR